jgi:hypothetical protein
MLIVVKKKSFIAIDHSLSHYYHHHCNYKNNFEEILRESLFVLYILFYCVLVHLYYPFVFSIYKIKNKKTIQISL